MTDIIERLCQCDENFELAQEAADEIESLRRDIATASLGIVKANDEIKRLRAALKDIIQAREDEPNDFRCITKVLLIAANALAGGAT